jgi:WG containing repeat
MKTNLTFLLIITLFLAISCNESNSQDNYLVKISEEDDEIGETFGYANLDGEVIIALDKYYYCYTDTFVNYAIVMDYEYKCIAIDRDENVLYDVFMFDNGPDYIEEGLFRIVKDGKMGFANEDGEIVIKPEYDFAFPFEDGEAKVTFEAELIEEFEMTRVESDSWFFIDKEGNKID